MFLTRNNQENLTYAHQTAAAAKPLNSAKTPSQKAPKTPFRANGRDENVLHFGAGPQTGKLAKTKHDVFVTPAATQARAPLGLKTTNVKARPLQTPGANIKQPPRSVQKQTSPRLRRSKVKIHQAEPEVTAEHEVEVDIEYMPPRSVPLPDFPEHEDSEDERMKSDAERIYQEICKENILPDPEYDVNAIFRRDERTRKAQDRVIRAALAQDLVKQPHSATISRRDVSRNVSALRPKSIPTKSTVTASTRPVIMDSPSFAKPTAAALSRGASAGVSTRAPTIKEKELNKNHAAATTTSRSTLGYSRGRVVSASTRPVKGPSEAHRAPVYKKVPRPASAVLYGASDGLINDFKRASLDNVGLGGQDPEVESADNGQDAALDFSEQDMEYENFKLELVDDD